MTDVPRKNPCVADGDHAQHRIKDEPRATAQSTPITIPIAMQATDMHNVLSRPSRMLGPGQIITSRTSSTSRCRPMANARIRNAAEGQDSNDRDDPAVVPRTDVTEPSDVDFLGERKLRRAPQLSSATQGTGPASKLTSL